ncbi:hypothetical protein SAMN04489740_0841 [Arthrobacter alpinus]|uniref:Uncharacterized protein n=1 Tax=Arthrobacter alpinus TaxID=656366 RepID=A0A1H5GSR4_9MICC|nr:hypothetical protein SAMN04489740_0841 [Arthrobacter alpinus]
MGASSCTKHRPDENQVTGMDSNSTSNIWCNVCQTDEYILLESASRRRRNGSGVWDVDYTCMHCDSFYGHEIEIEDLNASTAFAIITLMQEPGHSVRVNPG